MGSLYFLNIRHLHLLRDVLYSGAMYETGSHGDISDLCYFFSSLLRSEPSKRWRGRLGAGRRRGEPAPDTLSSHCSAASRSSMRGRIYLPPWARWSGSTHRLPVHLQNITHF